MGNKAFSYACLNGFTEMANTWLNDDSSVDPSCNSNRAIRYASRAYHTEVVKLLLSDQVDSSSKDNFAIRFASERDHMDIVKLLLNDLMIMHLAMPL